MWRTQNGVRKQIGFPDITRFLYRNPRPIYCLIPCWTLMLSIFLIRKNLREFVKVGC
jgi:hypothetical protein